MGTGFGVSDPQFHELAHGQCQNSKHEMAQCLDVAPHAQVPGSELVLETTVHPFDG